MVKKIGRRLLAAASLAALAAAPGAAGAAEAGATAADVLLTTAELQAAMNGSFRLRRAVTVEGIRRHLRELAAIGRNNGDTRVSGTPGYAASSRYVRNKLRQAGYGVRVQSFDFTLFEETAPPSFARVSPDAEAFAAGTDFLTIEHSGSGTVTGPLVPTNDIQIPRPA